MKKTIQTLFALFLISLFAVPFVSAAPIMNVEVKGVNEAGQPVAILAGENVPIKVSIRVMEDIEDVYARAELAYENGKITALTSAFDLYENSTYVLDASDGLYLGIPQDIASDSSNMSILIQLEDNDGDIIESEGIELKKNFMINLQRETNRLKIQNVTMPDVFNAGEKTLVTATIKNLGTNIQDDVYAQLAVSRLGVLSKEEIGSITEAGDDDDTQTIDIPLNLPAYIESGTYTLELKVFNDVLSTSYVRTIGIDGYRKSIKFTEVMPRDVVLDVEQDGRAVYRISILNLGTETQTYDISLADNVKDWGTVQIEPNTITLEGSEKKEIEVYVSPNKETLGEQIFTLSVNSDNKLIDELKLVADVKESELKFSTINPFLSSLIIAAIILVVVIVGMFGLRLRKEYNSRLKAVTQVAQAKDIGREEAKTEMTNIIHDMIGTIIKAKDSEKDDLIEKAAERASRILHPLRSDEVNDVMTGAVSKLSEDEEVEDKDKIEHKINVRNHTQNIIDKIIEKLKGKEEVDDVLHEVAHKIDAQELGKEGTGKAITTLEALRERLGNEIDSIQEEEEVIRKARKKKVKKKSKKKVKRRTKRVKSRTTARKLRKSKKTRKTRKRKKHFKKQVQAITAKKKEEKPSLVEKISTTKTVEKY